MDKSENEIPKIKKIKKVTIITSKDFKTKTNNSLQKSVDNINHNLLPKIAKKILKKPQRNRNIHNSQRLINTINNPLNPLNPLNYQNDQDKDQNLNSTINIIDNSLLSRNNQKINSNNTNQISMRKSYNETKESQLNKTNIYLSDKKNANLNKSCLELNEHNKEINNFGKTFTNIQNKRKLYKSKTQVPIFSGQSLLPNINNNTNDNNNNHNNDINNDNNDNNNNDINCPIKTYLNKKSTPVKQIYDYYISQESKNIIKPIKNYDQFFKKKYKDPKKRFYKIYCINKSYLKRTKEIKNNHKIAFKDDFDIDEYQNALLQFLQNRVDIKNLLSLGQDYKEFNERINNKFSFKGRFTDLANRIRNHAPTYLVNKLRELDKKKLMKRAKFLNSSIDIDKKSENKKENYFEEFELYLENKFIPNIYQK